MPQPDCDRAARVPGGSITERLLAPGAGLERLCEPLGDRYAARRAGDGGQSGGGFSKYPGWDEQPHPWSQRAGSGHTVRGGAGDAVGAEGAAVTVAGSATGRTDALGGSGVRR